MDDFVKAIQDKLDGNLPFKMRDDVFTLVIGLGGSGLKFAGNTKELLCQRYGEKKVSDRMVFYCLDTDTDDKPKNMADDTEFRRLTGLHDDPWVNGWLNPILLKRRQDGELKENEPGAAGIRMLGRWKLFSTAPYIISRLETIINRYKEDRLTEGYKKLFVIVMASVCGGTGCGTFIDIPYFVKYVIDEVRGIPDDEVSYYGMLELPDSKIASANPKMDPVDEASCMANAYAAMKDLEYFMSEHAEYTAAFRNRGNCKIKKRIFTQCFLLSNSASDPQGGTYDRNTRDRNTREIKTIYLNKAIPEAVNIMISQNDGVDVDGNMLGFDSKMSNVNGRGFRLDELTKKELLFSSFGVSKIEIPMAQIILAIFSRVFLALKSRWELIEDKNLMEKVIKREIPIIFKIEDTFDKLMGILDVRALKDTQFESPSFVTDLNAMINGLPLSDGYIDAITELRKNLKKKIDEIYSNHGPFFALKIFEIDNYGSFLNYLLKQIKDKLSPINAAELSGIVAKYKEISSNNPFNPFKKKEKAEVRKKLLDAVETYAKQRVYLVWEKQINDLKTEISRDYHEGLFKRVTEMVKNMRDIFSRITGIDSYTHEEQVSNATIFTWNFSDVAYDAIYEKVNFLFGRKIISTRPGNPSPIETITKSKIYQVLNERTNTDKELFYWTKTEGPIEVECVVKDEDNKEKTVRIKNVTTIEEVMQFGNAGANLVPIETMIKSFLNDVKENREKNITDIILDNFSDIVEQFNNLAFVDMIILSSPGVNFSQPTSKLSDETKKQLFKRAIEQFSKFALPSFPVFGKNVPGQLDARKYTVSLAPEFPQDYSTMVNKIISEDSPPLTKPGLTAMITVNFYFDYGPNAYIMIGDCKKEYDKIKDTRMGAGLHIAEGMEEDIRPNLRELV